MMLEQYLASSSIGETRAGWVDPNAAYSSSIKRRRIRPAFWLLGAAAVLVGAVFHIPWPTPTAPAPPPDLGLAPVSVINDLAEGMAKRSVYFESEIIHAAVHPYRPCFAVATRDLKIKFFDELGRPLLVAETQAPVSWLAFESSGQRLIACDWSGAISIIPLDFGGSVIQKRIDPLPIRAYLEQGDTVVWIDRLGELHRMDLSADGKAEDLPGRDVVQASSSAALAWVTDGPTGGAIQLDLGNGLPTITRRVAPSQDLLSFDVSSQGDVVIFGLSDGTIACYRLREGRYEAQEINLGGHRERLSVHVDEAGRYALIGLERMVKFDLVKMEPVASLTHRSSGGRMAAAWQVGSGRIFIADNEVGNIWEP